MMMHLDQDNIYIITTIMTFVLIALQMVGKDFMSGCHSMIPPPKLHINCIYMNTFKVFKITQNIYSRELIIL